MDLSSRHLISTILSSDELEQTPPGVQEKLRTWIDGFIDEYCKNKAAANRLRDYEQESEELQALIQDYEHKLESQNKNVAELRAQLDSVSSERVQLLEQDLLTELNKPITIPGNIVVNQPTGADTLTARRDCRLCLQGGGKKLRRKTRFYCIVCKNPVCQQHSKISYNCFACLPPNP